MTNRKISAPLLPSTGYSGNLMYFIFVFYISVCYINFNKITLSKKLVEVYTDSKTNLLSHCTNKQNVTKTINQCK